MKFIQGYNRSQTHLFPTSLEASIDTDNEMKLIDLFVDSLDLNQFGFKTDFIENGRPAYHPSCLLKLYIYCYLNKEYTIILNCMENESHCGTLYGTLKRKWGFSYAMTKKRNTS